MRPESGNTRKSGNWGWPSRCCSQNQWQNAARELRGNVAPVARKHNCDAVSAASPSEGAVSLSTHSIFVVKSCVKSLTDYLWFEVPNRRGFVNITETVEALVRKSGHQGGALHWSSTCTSAPPFISNDAEDGLLHDYEVWLEKLRAA